MMREPGFYWVKHVSYQKDWQVAELSGGDLWYFCGDECAVGYCSLAEIGAKIEAPIVKEGVE